MERQPWAEAQNLQRHHRKHNPPETYLLHETSPPPPYNLTKYEELEEATLKPDAMARTRWSACGSYNPKTHFTAHPTKKNKQTNEKQKNSSSPSLSLLVFCFEESCTPTHTHTHNQDTFTLVFSYFLMYPSTLLGIHDLYLQITALLSLSTKTPENTRTSFYCLPSSLVLQHNCVGICNNTTPHGRNETLMFVLTNLCGSKGLQLQRSVRNPQERNNDKKGKTRRGRKRSETLKPTQVSQWLVNYH
jgi:hypothetical protein